MIRFIPIVSLILTLTFTANLWAQTDPPPTLPKTDDAGSVGNASATVDAASMMVGEQVFPSRELTDSIWVFKAAPGKKIVRIPLIITVKGGAVELATSDFGLRRGRMLAWHLIGADEPASAQKVDINAVEAVSKGGLPVGVPRFARKITVSPDGMVTWKMDRSIIGGETTNARGPSANPYVLKMNRDAMDALKPKRPAAGTPPTDPKARAAYAAKKRAEEARYRSELSTYNKLASAIRKLPDEFAGKQPAVVWAVFEIGTNVDTLELEGPSPLPWSVSIASLDSIHEATKSGAAQNSNDAFAQTLLATLEAEEKPHSITLNFVTQIILKKEMLKVMEADDPIYKATDLILTTKDEKATGALSERLALIQTDAAKKLFKKAVDSGGLTTSAKLKSLESLFAAKSEDIAGKVDIANSFLADANGPDAGEVVGAILAYGTTNPQAGKLLATDMKFADVPSSRLTPAIIAVMEAAAENKLAGTWLNDLLLDPNNPTLADTTLSQLSTRRINSPITVEDKSHNLYVFLNHVESQVRDKAWKSMVNFKMADGGANVQWPDAIAQSALLLDDTPDQAVAFLSRHKADGVGDALAQIVLTGDDQAADQAARRLLSADIAIDSVIARMSTIGDRYTFAQRLYQIKTRKTPLVVNLLRSTAASSEVTKWFGQEIKSGNVPHPSAWINVFADEKRFLELIIGKDDELALGALAALVNGYQGTDDDARKLMPQFKGKEGIGELLQVWESAKTQLGEKTGAEAKTDPAAESAAFYKALKTFSGQYKASLNVTEGTNFQLYDMGTMLVTVQGNTVKIGKMEAEVIKDDVPRMFITAKTMKDAGLNVDEKANPVRFRFDGRGNWFTDSIQMAGGDAEGVMRLTRTD